ncbi:hypothetical protein EJ04DRAFT_502146 [Polyplosphaeria fusca]|uniref:Mediator of RNA polymerase II transcription subunit 13 n=1 Tax=Polyplosphaeria fusca TaxID=682080 RepID=A0A9P4QPW4_9PLEO|nr:hypothetical protein EJ04DRAFT_502146 [Polyplosphaeria fusca]
MEFLKTCSTNAQAIGDFEAVAFRAFSIRRTTTSPSATYADRTPAEDSRAVEAELRTKQQLVVQDASRPWIWLFRATAADKAAHTPVELPVLDGYQVHVEQSGAMKASELARPPMRSLLNPNTMSSTPTSTAAPKGPLSAASRPAHSMDHQQPHDTQAVYELFMSSVIALVSFYLVKDHNAATLNYRTLVSKPQREKVFDQSVCDQPFPLYWLTNMSVYWTSSGTLVLSMFSVPRPELCCLVDRPDVEYLVGKFIRTSPNGLLAKVLGSEDLIDTAAEDTTYRTQRKKVKVSPLEQSIDRWKTAVARWLAWKGYTLSHLERRSAWVKIQITQTNSTSGSSPTPSLISREILWPRACCFYYDDSSTQNERLDVLRTPFLSQTERGLEWFETSNAAGYRDPLDAAQQWFLAKPERDKILEKRRKAKKAEEEAVKVKEENHGLYPSSPLNSRTGAYGDIQAVSGVYPTPPDGVAPGTTVSNSDHLGGLGAATNTLLPPGATNPGINVSAPQDGLTSDSQLQPATSPAFSLPYEQFATSGATDDLFEDMEEDELEGNGVTDADFNFFDDEPGGGDLEMIDAPTLPDSADKVELGKEESTQLDPESNVKEEMSDPLAALEDALATPTAQNHESVPYSKAEEIPSESPSGVPKETLPLDSQATTSQAAMFVPPQKEPTPPLSPHLIQEKLLPSPKTKGPDHPHSDNQHRESVFDPVNFSKKMSISDAKYHDGRFNFDKRPHTELDLGKKVSLGGPVKRPASLRDLPMLTKLRYAIGVAATRGISEGVCEVKSPESTDSDESETSSEASSDSDDGVDDLVSVAPAPLSASLINPAKRKLPTDGGNATPMSTTSFAESLGMDSQDSVRLHTDNSILATLEPNAWDWSLADAPSPALVSGNSSRNYVPSFPPAGPSMPGTPTSQSDGVVDQPEEKPLSGKDSIAIAQIVTDQIVTATLDVLHEQPPLRSGDPETPSPDPGWQGVVKQIFPKAIDCSVQSLICVPDVFPDLPAQIKGQTRPPPRKPNETALFPGFHINQISAPHVRVRRSDTHWDLLPPALAFWEPLGLSPSSPPKNVVSFCIYPHSDATRPCLENFLLNIQIAYESCRLGNHTRVETVLEFEGGLVPCRAASTLSTRDAFKALRDTCVQLGSLLAAKHAQLRDRDEGQKIDAFVIYMMDSFESSCAVWQLCSAFWSLFQAYGQTPPGRQELAQKPDLVLQIVPMKYVASFDGPVVLDNSVYLSLAREVYDRCPPSAPSEDKTSLNIYTAPSFQLEEAVPRAIPFKLNSEPPQDLLRENSYIHIAYAMSRNGAWVTAAWTDSCGKSQAVVSYNLGTRIFGEVAKEIWQTTIEILAARRVTWRVCIAKSGVMEREELETWIFLASCPTQLNLFITLLTVDPNPPLRFTPKTPTNSTTNTTTQPATNTPGSTPQPGVSPDNVGLTPAATPSENTNDPSADPDARLIDVTDEAWGIILSHRLHNSNSTVEFRPCLISGLLVKRGESVASPTSPLTPDPEPGPIIIGVNILWVGAVGSTRTTVLPFPPAGDGVSPGGVTPNPAQSPGPERASSSLMWTPTAQSRATAENLLKEVLGHYRALGTLAKLKGMRGTREGTVPWHIAAARRGVEGIARCAP